MTTTTIDILERIRDFYRLDSIQCRLIGAEWSLIAWRTVAPSGYHSGRGETLKAAVLELERSLDRSLLMLEEAQARVSNVLPQTGGPK